jgi:hypothetical protein
MVDLQMVERPVALPTEVAPRDEYCPADWVGHCPPEMTDGLKDGLVMGENQALPTMAANRRNWALRACWE